MKYYGNINVNGNQLKEARLENLTQSMISSGTFDVGAVYFNTDLSKTFVYNGQDHEQFISGNVFIGYKVVTDGGNVDILSDTSNSIFTFIEGTNVKLNTDPQNKSITINADTLDFSENFYETIGDGSTTTFNIQHDLGSKKIIVQLWDTTSGNLITDSDVSITDDNNISVVMQNAPISEGANVVISSNMGPMGPQGPAGSQGPIGLGTQGPQGPSGQVGNSVSGDFGDLLYVGLSNAVVSTDVINVGNSSTGSHVTIADTSNEFSMGVIKTSTVMNPKLLSTETRLRYSTGIPTNNSRHISSITEDTSAQTENEVFSVDSRGLIKTKGALDDAFGTIDNRIAYIGSEGDIRASDYNIDISNIEYKKRISITDQEILSGQPIEILPSQGSGTIIIPHRFIMRFLNRGAGRYTFPGTVGIVCDSTNTNSLLFKFNPNLINGHISGYQAASISFNDDPTHTHLKENKGIYYKSMAGPPVTSASNVGVFDIIFYYSLETLF